MGDIIGRGFDEYVRKQVIKRQEKLAYGQTDIDVIRWNNSNNAFLRLSSGDANPYDELKLYPTPLVKPYDPESAL